MEVLDWISTGTLPGINHGVECALNTATISGYRCSNQKCRNQVCSKSCIHVVGSRLYSGRYLGTPLVHTLLSGGGDTIVIRTNDGPKNNVFPCLHTLGNLQARCRCIQFLPLTSFEYTKYESNSGSTPSLSSSMSSFILRHSISSLALSSRVIRRRLENRLLHIIRHLGHNFDICVKYRANKHVRKCLCLVVTKPRNTNHVLTFRHPMAQRHDQPLRPLR